MFFLKHSPDKRSLKQFHMPAEEPGFQALSTKRLILRKPELNDAREIFNLRSNEQVNQYLDRDPATDLEDATDFLNKIIQSIDGGEGSYWAICLKENQLRPPGQLQDPCRG